MVRLLAAPEGRLVAADPQVIHALRRKYRELLGRGGSTQDVAHVAAVLLMFRPDEDLSGLLPLRSYARQTDTASTWLRGALDALRMANAPMSAAEIAERVIAAQGLVYSRALHRNATASILTSLKSKPHVIRHVGRPTRWSV